MSNEIVTGNVAQPIYFNHQLNKLHSKNKVKSNKKTVNDDDKFDDEKYTVEMTAAEIFSLPQPLSAQNK